MSETEYASAVADFLSKRNITRCPTACVVPTRASVTEADRAALRQAKMRNHQHSVAF